MIGEVAQRTGRKEVIKIITSMAWQRPLGSSRVCSRRSPESWTAPGSPSLNLDEDS